MSQQQPVYRRVILKLSGEALKGQKDFGHDAEIINSICRQIHEVHQLGVQIGIVVGAGNIFRGTSEAAAAMNRTVADQIGMLGTLINAMTLQAAFERMAVPTRVMSAIEISAVAERYIRRRALRHMEKGRIVIFACGTGNPFFSTDTAGALRAKELEADVLLKATNVDGIYTADPRKNPDARRYEHITFREVLDQGLRVMDTAAFAMCHEDGLPIIVFDLHRDGNIRRVVLGEHIGTVVSLQAPASSSHSTQEPSHV